jgi:hypothetical protein
VDGVVLGVDGQQRDVVLAGGGEDEFAGGDQALLVGQADGLAGADGRVGGLQAGDADDGRDDEVRLGQRGARDRSLAVPWTTSVSLTPASRRRLASAAASSSVASETTRGRQRRHWAKASSMLRPAASETT